MKNKFKFLFIFIVALFISVNTVKADEESKTLKKGSAIWYSSTGYIVYHYLDGEEAYYLEFPKSTVNGATYTILDDPNITTYETTKGKGHIFYGLSLFHENPRMIPLGWVDQNGEKIPYTSGAYPYYTIEEDTEYTAVWGYEVILDANEGNFPKWNATRLMAVLEYDGKFSLANVQAQLGDAVPDDPNKYFVGWATTPNATEPDVIEGVTDVKDLDTIYAIYKDDTYNVVKGDKGSWKVQCFCSSLQEHQGKLQFQRNYRRSRIILEFISVKLS